MWSHRHDRGPELAPYRADMERRLGDVVGAPVSVKAKRAEALGRPRPAGGDRLPGRRPARAGRPMNPPRPRPAPAGRARRRPGRHRPSSDHGLGGDQVEGRQAVAELLRAGARPVREVMVAEGLEPSAQLDDIERLAARLKVRVTLVPRRRFETITRTEAAQGVMARARPLEEADLDDLAMGQQGPCFLLVLDGVTDPHNVGSLLRSAECAGVTGAVVGRHRAAHVTPTVAKVAAGAIEHVPIAVVPGIPAALARLDQLGVTVVGLDGEADRSMFSLGAVLAGPLALVLGAEGRGLGTLVRKRCSMLAAIPRQGRIASLNVATAGAVACFEVARQRSGR